MVGRSANAHKRTHVYKYTRVVPHLHKCFVKESFLEFAGVK